jgi:hypothetical protein
MRCEADPVATALLGLIKGGIGGSIFLEVRP